MDCRGFPYSESFRGTACSVTRKAPRRMKRRTWLRAATPSVLLPGWHSRGNRTGVSAGRIVSECGEKRLGDTMTGSAKVYELRIYHAVPGKLDSLMARVRTGMLHRTSRSSATS